MNANCECPVAGFCKRHGVTKNQRQHELCRGENCTPQQCQKYWDAWERGVMMGQSAPVTEPKPATVAVTKRSRGLGDRIERAIKKTTGVSGCGGCKKRAAVLNHWFPADLPPIEPVVLDAPVRHLMFHIWPTKRSESWRWNCDRLIKNQSLFNGRRIIGIVTSHDAVRPSVVKEYLKDFTDEFIVSKNNAKQGEVMTFVPSLERLEAHQGEQDVTFRAHTKGARHSFAIDDPEHTVYRWTEAMYETCLHWDSARELLEKHGTVGSFRRFSKPSRGSWGPWHFSGSFYWFRNKDAFARNWRYIPKKYYGTEAWPGTMFKPEETGVIVGDSVGHLYAVNYWESEIEPQLKAWRERHQGREK
jgi:hypothetical protein